MKRAVLVGAALLLLIVSVATAAPAEQDQGLGLDVYTVQVPAEQAADVARGRDVIDTRPAGDQTELDLVLTPDEAEGFSARGFAVTPRRDNNGRTAREAAWLSR